MTHRFIFILICCFVSYLPLNAQVFAPELNCVDNDTLLWTNVLNTCGTFNAYEILVSLSPDGPYSLLATVTNPTQDKFLHTTANDQTWYYYMRGDFNCPGQTVLSSDTLSNQLPERVFIESASVDGDDVVLQWTQGISPAIDGYIIYRVTTSGTRPIDTVGRTGIYIDQTAAPELQSENYFVLAVDKCGDNSLFGEPHATMLLGSSLDACRQASDLSWTPYMGWADGIDRQEIWVSEEGRAFRPVDTLSGVDVNYTLTDLNAGINYCVFVRAYSASGGYIADSNVSCFEADIIEDNSFLTLLNATVTPSNQLVVDWQWDPTAALNQGTLILQAPGGMTTPVDLPLAMPLQQDNRISDLPADVNQSTYTINIETVDGCDSLVRSNVATTIHLTGFPAQNLENELIWTPFELGDAVVETYEVYRSVSGINELIETVPVTQLAFTDRVSGLDNDELTVCYFIVATAELTLADGTTRTIRSRSNTICLDQFTSIALPNAFSPEGRNKEFKPRAVFADAATYQMVIYNRWGQQLFETRNINEGWDGNYKGRPQPWGVYTYFVQLIQPDGSVEEFTGNLVLVR